MCYVEFGEGGGSREGVTVIMLTISYTEVTKSGCGKWGKQVWKLKIRIQQYVFK